MFHVSLAFHRVSIFATAVAFPERRASHLHPRASLLPTQVGSAGRPPKSAAVSDSLKLLEWDKVCDSVSFFAGTVLGREATKVSSFIPFPRTCHSSRAALVYWFFNRLLLSCMPQAQLWSVDVSYEKSKELLDETSAAIELIKYGAGGMDFACIDTNLVSSSFLPSFLLFFLFSEFFRLTVFLIFP